MWSVGSAPVFREHELLEKVACNPLPPYRQLFAELAAGLATTATSVSCAAAPGADAVLWVGIISARKSELVRHLCPGRVPTWVPACATALHLLAAVVEAA